ncbi:hypothetical protein [Mycolicibacterium parafortuitum]|uniref:hypothetical protein n=1 Tax=Mycolicibacterium parafortuitum TaxID=39692 RepID=UPI0013D60763|nr:hypothetical protein [Mycolicibacterium parafortuitum]
MTERRSYTARDVELAVLRTVYDVGKFAIVKQRERPDFELAYGGSAKPFGVEITEIYANESDARLTNLDGYLQELWDGKPHRHRDDVEVLKTGPAKFLDKDGNVTGEFPVVMMEVTKIPSLPSLIAKRIDRKNGHITDYASGLTHVNLVIHDRVSHSPPSADEVFDSNIFLSDETRASLNSSSFNEVFLVSPVDGNSDQVVRPLRALALLEAGYGFMQAMTDADGNAVESWIDIHLLFIEICKGLGLDLRYVCDEKDGARAYFGGVGVQFHDNGMRLYELHNFPPPPAVDPPNLSIPADQAERLIGLGIEYFADKVFSSAFGFPAVTRLSETINAIIQAED